MSEMKNIEDVMRRSLEGYAPTPPERTKKRILATIMLRPGFWGSGLMLLVPLILLAGGTAAWFGFKSFGTTEPSEQIAEQNPRESSMTINYKTASEGKLPSDDSATKQTEKPATTRVSHLNKEAKNTVTSTIESTTIQKETSSHITTPSKKFQVFGGNSGEAETASRSEDLLSTRASDRQTNSSLIPEEEIHFWHKMSFLKLHRVPGALTENHIKDPIDFYMPKSPRSWSRWSIQISRNVGHVRGTLKTPESGISVIETKHFDSQGISLDVIYHSSPTWSFLSGLGYVTTTSHVLAQFEEERTLTQIQIIDGIETEVTTTEFVPVTEQEKIRLSYLTIPLGIEYSMHFSERFSFDLGPGAELWLLNFSHGKYRLSPERLLDLSYHQNREESVVRNALFARASGMFTYRFGHRMNIRLGVQQTVLLNNGDNSLKNRTGTMFKVGFGYRF